jgi:acyl carrier protein
MSDLDGFELEKRGREVLARVAGVDAATLRPEQNLVGDLGIDSVKALQLVMQLEDALGIEITDDDASKMDKVGDVLSYLASRS